MADNDDSRAFRSRPKHVRRLSNQIVTMIATHFPGDFVAFGVVFEGDGKIATFVKFTKSGRFGVSYARRLC
jgi:hypothetical protein